MWVVSAGKRTSGFYGLSFRPLAGCGLFRHLPGLRRLGAVSVPLRGVGCFRIEADGAMSCQSFRPLAGCGLFHRESACKRLRLVSVPLRGVGCFGELMKAYKGFDVSVPLRGVGCFFHAGL